MSCEHSNLEKIEFEATEMGLLKGAVATYKAHKCKDCGAIIDPVWVKSRPVLSEWAESCLGKRIDKRELTGGLGDIIRGRRPREQAEKRAKEHFYTKGRAVMTYAR